MRESIDAGHCRALPQSQHAPMALAQRARDAAFAQAMLRAPAGTRVVLIAGNGHVRSDIGVPHYLRAAGVERARIAAIGFIEPGDDAVAYDISRVTPAAPRDDPCKAFRR